MAASSAHELRRPLAHFNYLYVCPRGLSAAGGAFRGACRRVRMESIDCFKQRFPWHGCVIRGRRGGRVLRSNQVDYSVYLCHNLKIMTLSNRERLLGAATEVFLEHGYGASVDMLVARAGVARQTFYNHFDNKECLFAEAMRSCVSDILVPLNDQSGDLRESLKRFAHAYRKRVLSPQGIARFRIVASQAQRFPELTAEDYARGPGQMASRLSEFLGAAMSRRLLRDGDPAFAAEMLLSMLAGQERTRLLFGVANPPNEEELQVERIVDGFLRMFSLDEEE